MCTYNGGLVGRWHVRSCSLDLAMGAQCCSLDLGPRQIFLRQCSLKMFLFMNYKHLGESTILLHMYKYCTNEIKFCEVYCMDIYS